MHLPGGPATRQQTSPGSQLPSVVHVAPMTACSSTPTDSGCAPDVDSELPAPHAKTRPSAAHHPATPTSTLPSCMCIPSSSRPTRFPVCNATTTAPPATTPVKSRGTDAHGWRHMCYPGSGAVLLAASVPTSAPCAALTGMWSRGPRVAAGGSAGNWRHNHLVDRCDAHAAGVAIAGVRVVAPDPKAERHVAGCGLDPIVARPDAHAVVHQHDARDLVLAAAADRLPVGHGAETGQVDVVELLVRALLPHEHKRSVLYVGSVANR